jgi:hypothetical protein
MSTFTTSKTYYGFELRTSYIAFAVFHIVARIDIFWFTGVFAYFATRNAGNIGIRLIRFIDTRIVVKR